MRNVFAADIGDFGKYGLLRWLCGMTSGGRMLDLGIIWYWLPDDTVQRIHAEGAHQCQNAYRFICQPNATELALGECDAGLLLALRKIAVGRERSVGDVEESASLPDETVYFREPIDDPLQRIEWFGHGMEVACDSDIIFLDPDNGLVDDAGSPNEVAPVQATYQEARQLWQRGQSVVLYQHFDRNSNAEEQIARHATNVRRVLGFNGPAGEMIAIRFRRTIARVFFVIPNPANPDVAQLLRNRIDDFTESAWVTGGHFTRVDC